MQLGSTGKLICAVTIIICLSVLMGIDAIDAVSGLPPITLITGYIIGNGVASKTGVGVQSIIEPKPHTET